MQTITNENKVMVYTWDQLSKKGTSYIEVDYGQNTTRISNKCISLNSILVSNVDKIKVEVSCDNNLVTFNFIDTKGNKICSRVLKLNESFVVKDGNFDCPEYSFEITV